MARRRTSSASFAWRRRTFCRSASARRSCSSRRSRSATALASSSAEAAWSCPLAPECVPLGAGVEGSAVGSSLSSFIVSSCSGCAASRPRAAASLEHVLHLLEDRLLARLLALLLFDRIELLERAALLRGDGLGHVDL